MPRIVPLLVLVCACWIASDFGIASAQSTGLPRCDPKKAEEVLHSGGFPNLTGCRSSDAAKVLSRYDYQVRAVADESITGVPRGFVTHQSLNDGIVTLSVSTGRGFPPAAPPPPATQTCPDGRRIPATETCPDSSPPQIIGPPIVTPVAAPIPVPHAPSPPPKQTPKPTPPPAPPVDQGCQQQIAFFRPPHFSITAPAQVREGDSLTLTVHRDTNDCRPHQIELLYDPGELLVGQPLSINFSPENTEQTLTITTDKGRPGDGDKSITISLRTGKDATVGDPGSATLNILDTTPTTYTVEAPHGVGRGGSMEFTVSRHGPADAAQAEYQFDQPNGAIDQAWRPINFDPNGVAKLALAGDAYRICADPPLVRIRVGNQTIEEAASFSGYVPKECRPKPGILEWLQDNVPYWPLPAIPVGALLGFGLWKLARRFFNGKNGDPGPPPVLYPTWDIDGGDPPPLPDPPEIPGWPKFSSAVEIEWGGSDVPDPLPIAEPNDG